MITPEQYLEIERAADTRSEYFSGEMVAMSGASVRHEAIVANITTALQITLRGKPCRSYSSNLRVRIRKSNFVYPDVTVVCAKPELLHDSYLDTLLNPTVVFEVLSDSTESYDRGLKWKLYQQIESLQHYVLIAQNAPRVEVYTRQTNGDWLLHIEHGTGAQVTLPAIDATLQMADLYEDAEFADGPDSAEPHGLI